MSKAEELREGMIQQYALSPREIEPMRRRLEVLLAAAHAEGVGEGYERGYTEGRVEWYATHRG
jgi:hypothetical protein